jgi:hypothetical protein
MSINLLGFILFFKIFSKYKVTGCGFDNGVQSLTEAGASHPYWLWGTHPASCPMDTVTSN